MTIGVNRAQHHKAEKWRGADSSRDTEKVPMEWVKVGL